MDQPLELLRQEWERHRAERFALLREVPSTGLRCFLDYFSDLAATDQKKLSAVLPYAALCVISKTPIAALGLGGKEITLLERHRKEAEQRRLLDWRYQSLRALKTSATLHVRYGGVLPLDDAAVDSIRTRSSAGAALLKRLLKARLAGIGLSLVRPDPGSLCFDGDGYRVCFDFGGLDTQLRYSVEDPSSVDSGKRRRLSYEGVLGLLGFCPADGGWNFITEAEAGKAVDLLSDFIVRTAGLRDRVDALLRAAG